MTSVDNLFPSKFLKAADLGSKVWRLKMDRLEMQDIGEGDTKPVLFFHGAQKGLVLNKTNANRIAHAHGKNMDGWWGREVQLRVEHVDFKGDIVPAIRVVLQDYTPEPPVEPAAPPAEPQNIGATLPDDEIPF